MRKIKLTGEQMLFLYTVVNQPSNPQMGLQMTEVRVLSPILEKITKDAVPTTMPNGTDGLKFVDAEITLKESEFNTIVDKFEKSYGWDSVEKGHKADKVMEYLKESSREDE